MKSRRTVREIQTEGRCPAAFAEPAEALLFELVFGDHFLALCSARGTGLSKRERCLFLISF
jgi:hypothetical protein